MCRCEGSETYSYLSRILTGERNIGINRLDVQMKLATARQRFTKTENDLFDFMWNTRSERVHFVRGFIFKKDPQINRDKFAPRWSENCRILVSMHDSAIPHDVCIRSAI